MVTAIVLLNVKRESIPEVAERIAALEQVSEVYSVAGRYDLVVMVRVPNNEQVADLVTGKLLKEEAITHSETLIGFRAYSRFDLERLFATGLD